MTIHYFMFEAVPSSDNPEKDDCAGAYINCWVRAEHRNEAQVEAESYIRQEAWKIVGLDEYEPMNRAVYEGDPELALFLECFDQAVDEGIAAIFYVWSEEEED